VVMANCHLERSSTLTPVLSHAEFTLAPKRVPVAWITKAAPAMRSIGPNFRLYQD
jgi:hypothetical protein